MKKFQGFHRNSSVRAGKCGLGAGFGIIGFLGVPGKIPENSTTFEEIILFLGPEKKNEWESAAFLLFAGGKTPVFLLK